MIRSIPMMNSIEPVADCFDAAPFDEETERLSLADSICQIGFLLEEAHLSDHGTLRQLVDDLDHVARQLEGMIG
ncbi:MAG: hypothetical protein O3A46_09690 [Candidatus Poribacteria bacterium]|nr:hypothetical protein [Candidatus Poribacteria bacterium]